MTPIRHGFTLVEILVVVIILGIASALVVPNLARRDDLNAAAAARVVVADVTFAQNQAILCQAMRYITIDAVSQKYSLLTSTPNATPVVYQQNPTTLQNYITYFSTAPGAGALQNTTLLSPNVDNQTCLAFDSLGQPYSCSVATGISTPLVNVATIPIRCGTFTLTVRVEPYTGAMTVQ